MRTEVLEALRCRPAGLYVDGTVGDGGHAEAILEASAPDGVLIGIDRDADAIRRAGEKLGRHGDRVRLVHDEFRYIDRAIDGLALRGRTVREVDGILMDLGVSTLHLMDSERGFSFQKDGPLDMRMDRRAPPTAADLVNSLPEQDLARILAEYGEERRARRIARAIVEARKRRKFTSTLELAEVVRRAVPPQARHGRLHPATRTFQAIRIAVNRELEYLGESLETAASRLGPGARFCVITFHSLEDRIVKRTFKALAQDLDRYRLLMKKPLVPGREEIALNPRSRSAKLRVIERLAAGAAETFLSETEEVAA